MEPTNVLSLKRWPRTAEYIELRDNLRDIGVRLHRKTAEQAQIIASLRPTLSLAGSKERGWLSQWMWST